jgi:tetratricopeptide (TPR) repeat protein
MSGTPVQDAERGFWHAGEEDIWHAEQAYENNNYVEAIRYYTEAIQHKLNGRFAEPIQHNARFAAAYNNRGMAEYHLCNMTNAIADFTESIRLKSFYAAAYNNRGMAKYTLKDIDGAIDDYDQCIHLDPNDAAAYYNRGNAKLFQSSGDGSPYRDRGIDDFTEAIRLNPSYAAAYNNRGNAKFAVDDKKGAIDDYTHAIRIDPNHAEIYTGRGIAKGDLDDKKGAADDYTHAIRVDPNNPDRYYNRGNAKSGLNDMKGAIDDYTHAIGIDPNHALAYNGRGRAKADLNDHKGAIDDWTHAIRIDPNDAGRYCNRGVAEYKLDDKKGAIDDCTHAIRLDPNYVRAYCIRGIAKSDLNDMKGAIDDYTHAIRLNPNYADIYTKRGLAKSALNDHKGAIDDFTHVIRLRPNDANAHHNRASAKQSIGDVDGATNDLKEAAQLGHELAMSTLITLQVVLPVAKADDLSKCSVCQTSFVFAFEEGKLAQREVIYHELAKAVRSVIAHDRTHHTHSHASDTTPDAKANTPNNCSDTRSHSSADATTSDAPQCNWRYGNGVVVPKSVSNVCFGVVPQTMDRFTTLEDIAYHIVDQDSARRLYQNYDNKTNILEQLRRSDRMIDESMSRHDFDATPVLLHCGHTVCRGCAYTCVRAHTNASHDTLFAMVNCPTRCNRETAFVCDLGVEWLPVDFRRIRLLQKAHENSSRKPMCSEHKDRAATVRCTNAACAEFALMCAECNEAEHSARRTCGHVRVPASEMDAATSSPGPAADSLCSVHQQPLTGVCVSDGVPVCDKCLYDHIGHDVKRLDAVCSDWSKKLETLQRSTLMKAHVLSDRVGSVQHQFDELVSSITSHFDSLGRGLVARRDELLFEARRWRKMQLEESKLLAAEASQLSATAMYERMLLDRILEPGAEDSKSNVSGSGSGVLSDAILGSAARQAQAIGSVIALQSTELENSVAMVQPQDMHVVFDSAAHSSMLEDIKSTGAVTVCSVELANQ